MSDGSAIEWTDATWNPVRGCTKVSPGCKHCYAETFSERFRGVPGHPFEQGFDLRLVPDALELPLKWRASRRIFVNSMSDLFHEDVPDEYIVRVFDVSIESEEFVARVDELRRVRALVRFLSVEPLLGPIPKLNLRGIRWVIVGGESGPRARPMMAEWVRSIRDRCVGAHVPFFFKQWGGVRKHTTGRVLDGRTWDEMPDRMVRLNRGLAVVNG